MEVCLPADFYKLRDELPVDWRDASSRETVNVSTHAEARASDSFDGAAICNDSINACADPSWKVF